MRGKKDFGRDASARGQLVADGFKMKAIISEMARGDDL